MCCYAVMLQASRIHLQGKGEISGILLKDLLGKLSQLFLLSCLIVLHLLRVLAPLDAMMGEKQSNCCSLDRVVLPLLPMENIGR